MQQNLCLREIKAGDGVAKLSLGSAQLNVMPHVGCRFLVVDAKREAVAFYEHLGFHLIDNERNNTCLNPLMFFDLHKLN